MTDPISFTAKSGSPASGEIAAPEGTGQVPGLILIQEWWGLNEHIKSLADRFAKAGFLTVAPDLYHGRVTKDPAEAGKLMTELDGKRAMDDIAGAVQLLLSNPRCNGKIGIVGFCMGGAYSFAAASAIPEIGAAVPFYGIPPADRMDFGRMKAPILAHFASRDQWAKPALAEEIKQKINAQGGSMQLEIYDAEHAFMNDTRPDVYSPEAAEKAWQRTIDFLHKHLG